MKQYKHTDTHTLVDLFNMHPVRERNKHDSTAKKQPRSHNMKYSFEKEYLKRINALKILLLEISIIAKTQEILPHPRIGRIPSLKNEKNME